MPMHHLNTVLPEGWEFSATTEAAALRASCWRKKVLAALFHLGLDTDRRKGQAASAIKRISTNMADKDKRSVPTFAEKGGGIAQLGLRYRREEPANSGRSKPVGCDCHQEVPKKSR